MPEDTTFSARIPSGLWPVYVPRDERLGIDPRSGVTGVPVSGDATRVRLDYEGNRFQADNVLTFADRVYHAIGRSHTSYPTIARQVASLEDVVLVGWMDVQHGVIHVLPAAADTLHAWIGDPQQPFPFAELTTHGDCAARRRELLVHRHQFPEHRAVVDRELHTLA